jgi:hypothetical protein
LLGELKDAIAPAEAALNPDQRDEVDEVVTTLTSNLEKITEHGKRADGIVKAMLEHSRGSSAERRIVDLNALIDEAVNLAYHVPVRWIRVSISRWNPISEKALRRSR